MAVCRRAAPAGESAGRQLQPGWIPESHEIRRSGESVSHDSGPSERGILAIWADASKHIHQFASPAPADAAVEKRSANLFRWTDFGRGRIRGIDRNGLDRRTERSLAGTSRSTTSFSTRNGSWELVSLHNTRGRGQLSACKHYVRSPAGARRRD